ncbi:MAG: response regulator transcription factor [Candidatus Bipolaricaulia bacterium]
MTILVAEDDAEARGILARYLTSIGYQVHEAADGMEALSALERERPDALLLDLMMPRLDGWEVLSAVRAQGETPVLVITARDATDEVVKALEMGADDYVVKPFKLREVAARLKARLKDSGSALERIGVGDLVIDDRRKTVALAGEPVSLSPKEYELLRTLAAEPGRVFADEELVARVWPEGSLASSSDVKRYIHLLRRKLERDPRRPTLIVTVAGFGYKLAD